VALRSTLTNIIAISHIFAGSKIVAKNKNNNTPPTNTKLHDAKRALCSFLFEVVKNEDIPMIVLYTAIPQILSRLGHNNRLTVKCVKLMLSRVLRTYPKQTLWSLAVLRNSRDAQRKEKGDEIFKLAQTDLTNRGETKMNDLLEECKTLFKYVVKV